MRTDNEPAAEKKGLSNALVRDRKYKYTIVVRNEFNVRKLKHSKWASVLYIDSVSTSHCVQAVGTSKTTNSVNLNVIESQSKNRAILSRSKSLKASQWPDQAWKTIPI